MKIVRNLLALGFALTLLAPALAQQTEPAKSGADKPTLSTYDNKPPAQAQPPQSDTNTDIETSTNPETPRPDLSTPPKQYDDTSNLSEGEKADEKTKGDEDVIPTYNKEPDPKGQNQDLPAESYDKKPNPTGDAQKLDAVRYDEKNEANDGKEGQLEMKVLEGEVKP